MFLGLQIILKLKSMSVQIPISNDINALADALIRDIDRQSTDIFSPVSIVTQTRGMNSWLKYRMAEKLGVAANLSFLTPEDIVYEVYKIMGGNYKNKISRRDVDWLIFSILSEDEFKERFPERAGYFYTDDGKDVMKQWELAAKMADLFDQYQIYRSETIEEWNREEVSEIEVKYQWQAYLWKKMSKKAEDKLIDFTAIKKEILEKLKIPENQTAIRQKLPTLYLFGLSIVTNYHLEILHELSQYIDIHWYISNPAPECYWFEDESEKIVFLKKKKGLRVEHITIGHPLLTDWGKVVQNTFRLLTNNDEFINAISDNFFDESDGFNETLEISTQDEFDCMEEGVGGDEADGKDELEDDSESIRNEEIGESTLLSSFQKTIYENKIEYPVLDSSLFDDGTITITSNYSKRREVETVYNYILNVIESRRFGQIQDREIIVMVTDINGYAPYIRAVMDNAPHKFRYNIADEALSNGDTLVTALVALLEFDGGLFGAEEVLGLLSYKYIREKFGIKDLDLIRNAIVQANIRFGMENDYDDPKDDTYLVSWRYGLEKILYGICMPDEQKVENEKPFYTVETTDTVAGILEISSFLDFYDALVTHVKARNMPKTLQDWSRFIEQVKEDMFAIPDDEKNEDYVKQIDQLIKFENLDDALIGKIPFDVFNKRFLSGLKNETTATRFMSRGITFCSPLPFRSLPFKMVCMLGLNYDAFPRLEHHPEFNLIASKRELGDRNIKENDKHLFLESILSARNALYLSYIGRSIKDNKPIPPSILIDELLDYLQIKNSDIDVREKLVSEHPFYSFSTKYNKGKDNLLPNYFIRPAKDWPIPIDTAKELPEIKEFDIYTVWKFYEKNIHYYYNDVLGVYFEREEGEIEDAENFELDNLEQWKVRNSLLNTSLENDSELIEEKLYLSGQLPLNNVGRSYIEETKGTIEPLIKAFKTDFPNEIEPQTLNIDLEMNEIRFTGEIKNVFNNQIVGFNHGSSGSEKRRAKLAFQYLFAIVNNKNISGGKLYSLDKEFTLKRLAYEEAYSMLDRILGFFMYKRDQLIGYGADQFYKSLSNENAIKSVKNSFKGQDDYKNDYYEHVDTNMEIKIDEADVMSLHTILKETLLEGVYEK